MNEQSATAYPTSDTSTHFDAVVIGAGFSGLYATWRLRQLGLRVQSFDAGVDFGGVWNWNRYPGAQTDSSHNTYRFTFDQKLREHAAYTRKFPAQPEVLAYLNHVAAQYDLRRHYLFNTSITTAIYDEESNLWNLTTNTGVTFTATYFVTGAGLVSDPVVPSYPGLGAFEGTTLFTSSWPHDGADLKGKRIALIGTGSSGIQVTGTLASEASQLTVYQRTPNYVVPTGNRAITDVDRQELGTNFAEVAKLVRNHPSAFPFEASNGRLMADVSPEERDRVFEEMWQRGGFSFLYETFDDIYDGEGNEAACEFLRGKIREIVKDPKTAEMLTPHYPYGAKRPPTGDSYYQAFNEPHVDLVNVRDTPILEFTPRGIMTAGGEREFDIIVFATGFDAGTGAFTRMDIRGRGGETLNEHWAAGPSTYLGIGVHGFPNFFMVAGPHSPFSNLPPGAEQCGNWIAEMIEYMRSNGISAMEPSVESEQGWNEHVIWAAEQVLGATSGAAVNSWSVGANIEGKPRAYYFYFGGANVYGDKLEVENEGHYPSFEKLPAKVSAA
jgi:cation diffusion facilitator CzcD-associated flavoprotein CzcO